MAQRSCTPTLSRRALLEPWGAEPANDNTFFDNRLDRWRLAIDRLKPIDMEVAICFAQAKLAGEDFDDFCNAVLRMFGRA